jgi:hypothetical protein
MYASSSVPRAAAINETACSSVSDFDGRPPNCPFGGFTSAATFRPTRSSRPACRIARTSKLCAICTVRVDRRAAKLASASCTADRRQVRLPGPADLPHAPQTPGR